MTKHDVALAAARLAAQLHPQFSDNRRNLLLLKRAGSRYAYWAAEQAGYDYDSLSIAVRVYVKTYDLLDEEVGV